MPAPGRVVLQREDALDRLGAPGSGLDQGLERLAELAESRVGMFPVSRRPPVDPVEGWSRTSFTSFPVRGFPTGPALVTVFTNGIPSVAKPLIVTKHDR